MNVYKRTGSKYYWFKFTFQGQLIQRSTNVSNRRDAENIASAYRTQIVSGKAGIEPKKQIPNFLDAVKDFLEFQKVKMAESPNSYLRYTYTCKPLEKFFGKVKMNKIDMKTVEKFIVWRSKQTSRKTKGPVTRETINHEILVLKMIFKRLVKQKVVLENPCDEIAFLESNVRTFHVISSDEERRYLFACPQPLRDAAILIFELGLRPGEVFNLKRENVNIDKEFLKVASGKTKSAIRQLHLTEKVKAVLQFRLDKFKGEYLFPHKDKDFSQPTQSIDIAHRKALKGIGCNFRLYDARHSFATRAVEAGVDLLTLSELLGHSGLGQVQRYAHISESRKTEAIKRISLSKAV